MLRGTARRTHVPGRNEVGPVVQHHRADDLLPVSVDAADGAEGADCAVDERRAEQVLQRAVVEVDRVDGVRQRHAASRTEAVEERGGGARRGGVVPSQLDRRRRQLSVDDQPCQTATGEAVVGARHPARRCAHRRQPAAAVTTSSVFNVSYTEAGNILLSGSRMNWLLLW